VYCFDTGFVAYYKGWESLRAEDRGILWEHMVLNELCAHGLKDLMRYWRDKRKREVDFVFLRRGKPPVAIEAKWKAEGADVSNLLAFKQGYPDAELMVVTEDVDRTFTRKHKGFAVCYISLPSLIRKLS
jgi:predicted AAA+ superfamily ATPase